MASEPTPASPCWSSLTASPQTDRGLFYGDGLFETICVVDGYPRLLGRHLARLAGSALALGLAWSAERQQRLVSTLAEGLRATSLRSGVAKVLLTREATGRGYAPDLQAGSHLQVLLYRGGSSLPADTGDVRIGLCAMRLALQPALAGHKHLNRLEQVLARRECQQAGLYEGLLRSSSGGVIEATASNLFLLHKGRLITPDLRECGVAGVMREWLLDTATDLGLATETRRVTLSDLARAEGLLLTNALSGVVAVSHFAGPIGEAVAGGESLEAKTFSRAGAVVAQACQERLASEHANERAVAPEGLWAAEDSSEP